MNIKEYGIAIDKLIQERGKLLHRIAKELEKSISKCDGGRMVWQR